jgi:hypothetical protein
MRREPSRAFVRRGRYRHVSESCLSCVTRAELKSAPRLCRFDATRSTHARHHPAARCAHHAPRGLTIVIPDLRFSSRAPQHQRHASLRAPPPLEFVRRPACAMITGCCRCGRPSVDNPPLASPPDGPVAQLAEQQTLNLLVEGSTPSRFTNSSASCKAVIMTALRECPVSTDATRSRLATDGETQ